VVFYKNIAKFAQNNKFLAFLGLNRPVFDLFLVYFIKKRSQVSV